MLCLSRYKPGSDPNLSKCSEASAIRPGYQSSLPHAPDWAAYFPSWSLSFLTGKMGINTRLTLESRKVKGSDVYEVLSAGPDT